MVYDKNKSGDPDFDDKQPISQHGPITVTAGDGREVIMSESLGPVDAAGAHVNMDDPDGMAGDNRPAPGQVATETSDVQNYYPEDTPAAVRTNDPDAEQPDPAVASADSTKTTRRSSR